MNKLFNEGEKSGNKVSAEKAEKQIRKKFDVEDYLPVNTIKSYFSRRSALIRKGDIVILTEVNEEDEGEFNVDEDDDADADDGNGSSQVGEEVDEDRCSAVKVISGAMNVIDIQLDEWVAVEFDRDWYPSQFVNYDAGVASVSKSACALFETLFIK